MYNSFFVKLSIAAITGIAIFVGLSELSSNKKKLENNSSLNNSNNLNNKPYYSCKRNSVSDDLSRIQNTFGKISNCLGSAIAISDNLASLVNEDNNYGYYQRGYNGYNNNNGGGLRSNASIIF